MKIELIEETRFDQDPMYGITKDGWIVKWFGNKEEAQRYYDNIVADPSILEPKKIILKSHEIEVSLESLNQ